MGLTRTTLAVIAAAIAVTAGMDYAGLSAFSALPLMGLVLLFWLFTRHSRADWGLLEIPDPLWLDPERGIAALVLNGLFVAFLWRKLA